MIPYIELYSVYLISPVVLSVVIYVKFISGEM